MQILGSFLTNHLRSIKVTNVFRSIEHLFVSQSTKMVR